MKSRPAQYAGLVLLMLASLGVIFLPIGPRPEPKTYQVTLEAPKPFQALAGANKQAPDEADAALAAEFKTNEVLPQTLVVGTDGKTATIADTSATRAEAQARADRIVSALGKKFKGVKLSSQWQSQLEKIPAAPLFSLGKNFAVYAPLQRNGNIVPAMKLGLDLQGGVNLVLQVRRAMFAYNYSTPVSESTARDAFLAKVRDALANTENSLELDQADVVYNTDVPNQIQIRTQARDEAQFSAQGKAIDAALKGIKGVAFTPSGKPQFYQSKAATGPNGAPSSDVLKTTVEILRSRVDKLGVSEPLIQAQGTDRIIVQLPGLNDPQEAVDTIGKTAQMQIVLLPADLQSTSDPEDPNNQIFLDAQGQRVPNDVVLQRSLAESTAMLRRLLPSENIEDDQPLVSGMDVSPTTSAGYLEGGNTAIFFELNGTGARRFAAATREVQGQGRQIPIFLDQKCISSPVVQSAIPGGKGQITMGNSPLKEAQDLAVLLNSGALPAPIDVVENRTVSASLGNDSLIKSVQAGLVGMVAVVIFMIIFYRLPGFLANIALCVYFVLNLAAFILVGGTLTLPGIAGFLLAVAMSLDTNILVFERLKEEMAIQPTFAAALRAAFSRAWTAILDSHVTTLVAATVLFYFGTGPVKGFALTLGIGVILSLFSAISVTRLLMWSIAGIGEKNRKLFASTQASKETISATHGL